MEEIIKIVENLIKHIRVEEKLQYGIGMYVQAIENLLKRYKELEEENQVLKKYIIVAPNLDETTAVRYSNIQSEAYIRGRAEEKQKAEQIIHKNYIPISELKNDLEYMKKAKAPGVKRLLMKKGIIGYLEKLLEERNK